MRRPLAALLGAVFVVVVASGVAAKPKADCDVRNTDTNTCKSIWDGIGLPAYKTATTGKIAVCHDRYVVSHDNASRTPDWVVEVLVGKKLTGAFGRPSTGFSRDLCVPPDVSAAAGDYAGTKDKFEIGHMAPSEDFNNSDVNMRDTFVYSNASPQIGRKFNASIWKTLETEVRNAAKACGKLYVITGPLRGDGASRTINIPKSQNDCGGAVELQAIRTPVVCNAVNKKRATSCAAGTGVEVPVAFYKIAYDPKKGTAFAFVLPNRAHDGGMGRVYLEQQRVNVGVIEKLTGLTFFSHQR